MWPFAAIPVRLESLASPARIDVVATVVSRDDVTSPLSGRKAAFLLLEAVERVSFASPPSGELLYLLGGLILGDLVTLELEGCDFSVELAVRRAKLRLLNEPADLRPIEHPIPELVPLLGFAKRGGVLCQREHLVSRGDRLRLRAIVERAGHGGVIVRDDLAPVLLDELAASA